MNFSARTVVGAGANLDLDEVGVPKSIAMRMTIPEACTHFNANDLRKRVLRGTDETGGALYVIRKTDGAMIDLNYVSSLTTVAEELQIGDIVERMMVTGDLVVFNRQPSLHK